MASQRKRKNFIKTIQDIAGTTWNDNDNISNTFIDYFNNIFDSSNHEIMYETIMSLCEW